MSEKIKIKFDRIALDELQETTLQQLEDASYKKKTARSPKGKRTTAAVVRYFGSIAYYLDELKKLKDEHKN